MTKTTEWLILCVILILGGILLFSNLDLYDIWGDEIFTFPKGTNYKEVLEYTKAIAITVHPPFYNFIQFTYSELFSGMDTVKNRLFYAFFGFMNIIIVYHLGKELFNRKVALIAAFLCATSPFLVMYSRMLRYYPMNTFFVLIFIFLFLRYKRTKRWGDWILLTVAGTALAYGNYLGIIIIFVLFASLLLRFSENKDRIWKFALSAVVMFVLYLPWLPVVKSQIGREYNPYPELAYKAEQESPRVAQKGFGIKGVAFNSAMKVGFSGYVFTLGETTYPWRWFLTLPVLLSFAALFLYSFKWIRAPGEKNLQFLIFIFILSLLILIPLSEIHRNFSSRTFQLPSKIVFLLPIFLLIIAKSWSDLKKKASLIILGIIILSGNCYGLMNYFSGRQFLNPKFLAPWRTVQNDIENSGDPQDLILSDEEGLLHEMRITHFPLEVFGLVNAIEKVKQTFTERGRYHIYLVIRYRGDEQITLETLNVKKKLSELYPLVDTWNYLPSDPEAAPFWRRILGREPPEYLVQVFVFEVNQQVEDKPDNTG